MLPMLCINLLILKMAVVSQMILQSYISFDDHVIIFRHLNLSLFTNYGIHCKKEFSGFGLFCI